MSFPIAVIISTYNNPDFLHLVLQGYARQSAQDFSIYIADDGSSDKTRCLIERISKDYPVPIQHIWHEDQGFRKARIHNIALQRVKEPYVILTDGDCIPLTNMIAVHRKLAHTKNMISGSRILLSKSWTKHLSNTKKLPKKSLLSWLRHKAHGNINRLLPLITPTYLSAANQKLSGIHGCHVSCYTEDLLQINGFDESFEGWGREDSDLIARLLHRGLQRRNMRGTPVLHLWHKENPRDQLETNNTLLQACLNEKRQQAIKGIQQLDAQEA